jgi:hypothetical protein
MSDLQKLLSIIDGKVSYHCFQGIDYKKQYNNCWYVVKIQNSTRLIHGDFGYSDFHGVWLFDKDEVFIAVGHFE